jgi:hypothetical protein
MNSQKLMDLVLSIDKPVPEDTVFLLPTSSFVPYTGEGISLSVQNSRLFKKEIIREGSFVKNGRAFTITKETLSSWVSTFKDMVFNGLKVPVVVGHTNDPEKGRGWVRDLFVEGSKLFSVLELFGEGIKLADTTDVSIYSPVSYVDGKGIKYSQPIVHVALCLDPLISGMTGFESITASISSKEEVKGMDELKKIAVALGLKEGATLEEIVSAISSLKEKKKEEEKPNAEVVASLKKTAPIFKKSRVICLDTLVKAGKIVPVVQAKLEEIFGTDEAIMASITEPEKDLFEKVVAALELNVGLKLNEKTGEQTDLTDKRKTVEGPNKLVADAERRGKV